MRSSEKKQAAEFSGQRKAAEFSEKNRQRKAAEFSEKRRAAVDNDEPSKGGKKDEKEREFKLDILERTVLFVEHLIAKVVRLEEGKPQCDCQERAAYSISDTLVSTDTLGGTKRKRMVDHDDDDGLSDEGELSVVSDDEDDESNDDPGIHNASPPIASSDKQGERRLERENPVPVTQCAPSSDSVRLPSIIILLNHAPPPPSEVHSAHNSPYGPFEPHIFSSSSSPTSAPPIGSMAAAMPRQMSRRTSITSLSSTFSPSLHAYGYAPEREVAMRYAKPYTHTHGPEATMSPLALGTGLPSPPASGSTNPYNRVDPSPPTLRLPSPRGNLVEIREERP